MQADKTCTLDTGRLSQSHPKTLNIYELLDTELSIRQVVGAMGFVGRPYFLSFLMDRENQNGSFYCRYRGKKRVFPWRTSHITRDLYPVCVRMALSISAAGWPTSSVNGTPRTHWQKRQSDKYHRRNKRGSQSKCRRPTTGRAFYTRAEPNRNQLSRFGQRLFYIVLH